MLKTIPFTATALAIALGGATATTALAAPHGTPGYRIQRQENRIQQGDRSGQLVAKGYNRDQARLSAINAQREADLKANGGHLSAADKSQLQGELNRSSRNITFGKHNALTQPGAKAPGKVALPNLPTAKTPGYVGDRVTRQQDRINNGMATGQLTRAEYGRDVARLHQIDLQRDAYLKQNGGTLTSAEKAQLDGELNANSNDIHTTRNNRDQQ